MVSLESALASVNLSKYLHAFEAKNYKIQDFFAFDAANMQAFADEIDMSKKHLERFKVLVTKLKQLFKPEQQAIR